MRVRHSCYIRVGQISRPGRAADADLPSPRLAIPTGRQQHPRSVGIVPCVVRRYLFRIVDVHPTLASCPRGTVLPQPCDFWLASPSARRLSVAPPMCPSSMPVLLACLPACCSPPPGREANGVAGRHSGWALGNQYHK